MPLLWHASISTVMLAISATVCWSEMDFAFGLCSPVDNSTLHETERPSCHWRLTTTRWASCEVWFSSMYVTHRGHCCIALVYRYRSRPGQYAHWLLGQWLHAQSQSRDWRIRGVTVIYFERRHYLWQMWTSVQLLMILFVLPQYFVYLYSSVE